MRDIPRETSFFVCNLWTIPSVTLGKTDNPDEYVVNVGNKLFGFYLPYLSQKPINIKAQPVVTLVIAIADLGHAHAHNWVVCEAISKRAGAEIGLAEVVCLFESKYRYNVSNIVQKLAFFDYLEEGGLPTYRLLQTVIHSLWHAQPS